MGMLFGGRMGSWSVSSKSDSRWNKSGRGIGAVTSGGPQEMQDWYDKCKEKYGEPPTDLTYFFMKD